MSIIYSTFILGLLALKYLRTFLTKTIRSTYWISTYKDKKKKRNNFKIKKIKINKWNFLEKDKYM